MITWKTYNEKNETVILEGKKALVEYTGCTDAKELRNAIANRIATVNGHKVMNLDGAVANAPRTKKVWR